MMSSSGPSWQAKLQGSSLAFVKPMPKRGEAASGRRDSSFEMSPLEPDAAWAAELWSRLEPSSDADHQERSRVAGAQLGHFRIEEQIGRGGMGAVFRAIDTRLDRMVALKVLSPAQSNESSSIERFRNEARAAARMDHDNIARVYYIGEDRGLQFIAFEFVHGINVRELIEQRGVLTPADAVNYALQIAAALRHTDAAGVVHRDIKPSNIIITPLGRAKLVDLGLARKRDPQVSNDLTVDGATLGTFDYISPEQAKDPRNVDVRSDIYSLGCTLFHMLTGEPPYPVGTMLQKLLDHQGKEIPDAAAVNPRVPPELSAVVRKMMDSDPRERYASADALIDDLSLIAQRFGLRPAPADGVVWRQPRAAEGWDLWKQYGGWIITAALLLIVVFVIDRAQDSGVESLAITGFPEAAAEESRPDESTSDAGRQDRRDTSPEVGSPGSLTTDGDSNAEESAQTQPRLSTNVIPSGGGEKNGVDERGFDPFGPDPVDDFPPRLVNSDSSLGPSLTDSRDEPKGSTSPSGQDKVATVPATEKQRAEEPAAESPSTPVVKKDPFLVIAGGVERRYPTLEAACADAPDNALIELKFNGDPLPAQHPVRIVGKRLTIRAAKDYRPTLRFAASEDRLALGREEIVRMLAVNGGSLEIYNVDLQLTVDPQLNVGQWVLLSLGDIDPAEPVELHGVSVTLENERLRPAAVIERVESSRASFPDKPPAAVRIVAEDGFFRGEGEFILDRTIDPADIRLKNVAVAMNGALLRLEGTAGYDVLTDMTTGHDVELELQHVTAVLGDGVAHFDVQLNHSVPRLLVDAGDSVISTISPAPLITMQGELDVRDFRNRLTWSDDTTFLSGPNPVWKISGRGGNREFDRDQFDNEWTRSSRGTQLGTRDSLIHFRAGQSFSRASRHDLELNMSLQLNPAIDAASDGTDAGVDWEAKNFPRIPLGRQDEPAS